jgi:hypothetical protein
MARFKAVRVALLLMVLAGVTAWGLLKAAERRARREWVRKVPVDIVLLQRAGVPPQTSVLLHEALPRLDHALTAEFGRYRRTAERPFSFTLQGPVPILKGPPDPPEEDGWVARTYYYLQLRRYLTRLHEQGGVYLRPDAIRLYVVLEPVRRRMRFVEGFGASGGDLGVVRAAVDSGTVDQALMAMGHELLHCLGATDKYDGEGHAVEPEGLAEPQRVPPYPQAYAEIMVGEVPLQPGRGRLVESLAEMRIGPATALEIGWIKQ